MLPPGRARSVQRPRRLGGIVSDWFCRLCANQIRGQNTMPAYCPRCGSSKFEQRNRAAASPAPSTAAALEQSSVYAAPSNNPMRRITTPSAGSGPHRERRGAKRVHPKEPVEVRLSWLGPLKALNISATGLSLNTPHRSNPAPSAMCSFVELAERSSSAARWSGVPGRTATARATRQFGTGQASGFSRSPRVSLPSSRSFPRVLGPAAPPS